MERIAESKKAKECKYCTGDRDGYVTPLPKDNNTGFGACIWKYGINPPYLVVTGFRRKGIFKINNCPMCGAALKQMGE